jgi:excisionase family DNA binding protein
MAKQKTNPEDFDLMTIADACELLKVSRRTLYRMIAQEVVPAPRRMGRFRQAYFLRSEFNKHCLHSLS